MLLPENTINWLSTDADKTRSWNAPSVGEQVLVLCLGDEIDTGFMLSDILSDNTPAYALHWSFHDGAVIEYEPGTGLLAETGKQTATIKTALKILFDLAQVEYKTLRKLRSWKSPKAAR